MESASLSGTPSLLVTSVKNPPTYRLVPMTASEKTKLFSEPLPAPFEPSADQFPVWVSHLAMRSAAPSLFTLVKNPPTYKSVLMTASALTPAFSGPSPALFEPSADQVPVRVSHLAM